MISPYVLIPQINSVRTEWLQSASEDAIFLELWEIDTFEGGSASRARFLEKRAFEYQTSTKNVYVIVRTVALEQAKNMLAQGAQPELISFGIGAGEMLAALCQPIEIADFVRADLSAGGRVEGQTLAVPWCMGGYVLCSEYDLGAADAEALDRIGEISEGAVLGTGQAYNLPKYALKQSVRGYVERSDLTQYGAYEAFLRGNEFAVLLGTQRDLFRLNNKVKLGAIADINYQFLGQYTDLIQYLAVTTSDPSQRAAATQFVSYITSTAVQKKLTSIGMFCVNNDKIYTEKVYQQFEEVLSQKMQVMNVFVSNVWIKEEQER